MKDKIRREYTNEITCPECGQERRICIHLGVSADVLLELAPFSLPPIEEVTPL